MVFLRTRAEGQKGSKMVGGEQLLEELINCGGGSAAKSGAARTESGKSRPRELLEVKVEQLRGSRRSRRRRGSTAAAERGTLPRRSKGSVTQGCGGGGGVARRDAGGRERQLKEADGVWACVLPEGRSATIAGASR